MLKIIKLESLAGVHTHTHTSNIIREHILNNPEGKKRLSKWESRWKFTYKKT